MDNLQFRQVLADIKLEVRNFRLSRDGKSANFSCLVCGDSKTNRRKARFGVTRKDGTYVCHCFNCGYSAPFNVYLKTFHPNLYENYIIDSFLDKKPDLYDLDHLVEGAVSDKTLANIFYITKYSKPKDWLDFLKYKKISLKEANIKKLYSLHQLYHH